MESDKAEIVMGSRSLGALLQKPYANIQRNSYGKLAELGHDGIRITHSAVFRNLRPEGSRITELALAAGMTKQSMGYLVETLQIAGYVTLKPAPDDGRAKLVVLTSRGEAVVETLRRLSAELEYKLSDLYGNEWLSGLRKKLAELDAFLDT
ncbi:MAG: MarR family transcriptional regulator [Verrucomicrobia bacterium]|nr:MarR family transcriptional regulator [Verrucomicrobiota bacterium]